MKPAAFEPARPLKRAEVAKPVAKTKPAEAAVEAGGAAREPKIEAGGAAREPKIEAGGAAREPKIEAGEPSKAVEASASTSCSPVEPPTSTREPSQPTRESDQAASQVEFEEEKTAIEPLNAGVLSQPKKTLQGLPPPRRTTSTGRVMAVVPREGEAAEQAPARPVAHPPRTTQAAVAQARALINSAASAVVMQGEASAALSVRPAAPARLESSSHDLPTEDSRVTPASGVARKPEAESAVEQSTIQETKRAPTAVTDPGSAVLIRLERWHLWAAFAGLGATALVLAGLLVFWPQSPPDASRVPPPVPALPVVGQTPAPSAEAVKAAAPPPEAERVRHRAGQHEKKRGDRGGQCRGPGRRCRGRRLSAAARGPQLRNHPHVRPAPS